MFCHPKSKPVAFQKKIINQANWILALMAEGIKPSYLSPPFHWQKGGCVGAF